MIWFASSGNQTGLTEWPKQPLQLHTKWLQAPTLLIGCTSLVDEERMDISNDLQPQHK